MTNAARLRARYADRKSRRVCVECEAATDGCVRCIDCRARTSISSRNYDKRHPENARARMKRYYDQNPEKYREKNRQRRLEKKLRGECLKCPEPIADGSNHCAKHDEIERVRRADYNRRKREGGALKRGGRPRGSGDVTLIAATCECGAPRPCERCAHLDGGRSSIALVIDALRGSDGLSLVELCEAIGKDTSFNNGRRMMLRWVQELTKQGRIRRYWRESSGTIEHKVFRTGKSAVRGFGCWAYVLDGKTEREWKRGAA